MPIFEKPPLATLAPAKDRWTPTYLEHGRLEVDDSSVKWIGADRLVYRLPVATISAIMLGFPLATAWGFCFPVAMECTAKKAISCPTNRKRWRRINS